MQQGSDTESSANDSLQATRSVVAKIGTDLFEFKGNQYLLIVDYNSRFIEVALLNGTSAENVIQHTESIFQGCQVVNSDNGPQFSSDAYARFADDYQFKHITSSPYYPRNNGEAEWAVGTIKNLSKKEIASLVGL